MSLDEELGTLLTGFIAKQLFFGPTVLTKQQYCDQVFIHWIGLHHIMDYFYELDVTGLRHR